MINPLGITRDEKLIQINGKQYKIPSNVNLVKTWGQNLKILKRTRELAEQLGLKFRDFDKGVSCSACKYLDAPREPIEDSHEDCAPENRHCPYISYTNQVFLFTKKPSWYEWLFRGTKRFMAKDYSCIIADAFHQALFENGKLDAYRVDAPLKNFPHIREIQWNSKLANIADEEYRRMTE
jgi:hypothetical protein